jgi:hypothetical protein
MSTPPMSKFRRPHPGVSGTAWRKVASFQKLQLAYPNGRPYILLASLELDRQIWGAASIKRGNILNTAV